MDITYRKLLIKPFIGQSGRKIFLPPNIWPCKTAGRERGDVGFEENEGSTVECKLADQDGPVQYRCGAYPLPDFFHCEWVRLSGSCPEDRGRALRAVDPPGEQLYGRLCGDH